jgi:hypothetical protein
VDSVRTADYFLSLQSKVFTAKYCNSFSLLLNKYSTVLMGPLHGFTVVTFFKFF